MKNNTNIVLSDVDIEWILNDDPNDPDNAVLGSDNLDQYSLNPSAFQSRLDNGKEAFCEIGSFAVDLVFNKLFNL